MIRQHICSIRIHKYKNVTLQLSSETAYSYNTLLHLNIFLRPNLFFQLTQLGCDTRCDVISATGTA